MTSFGACLFLFLGLHAHVACVYAKPHLFQTLSEEGDQAATELGKLLSEATVATRPSATIAQNTGSANAADDTIGKQIMHAQKLFNDASSHDLTPEEKVIESKLASALAKPATLGTPDMTIPVMGADKCQPDLTQCPTSFTKQGSACVASDGYAGPCVSTLDLSGMSEEQKLAVAQICKVEFPCQDDCDLNFASACPSLWREVDTDVCEAPFTYSGECSKFLDTSAMSDKDKYTFGIKCGARWPCVASSGLTSASGGSASGCAKDYSASCPSGWSEDGVHCKAPSTYAGCSSCQSFAHMSPAEKQDWETLCNAPFPCNAQSGGKPNVSFLSAQTIPIDGYKIRNSLYLTQPMRTPKAAAVNVIMREDTGVSFASAKYKGMNAQIEGLKKTFEDGLSKLR